jgi:hypothetical protein
MYWDCIPDASQLLLVSALPHSGRATLNAFTRLLFIFAAILFSSLTKRMEWSLYIGDSWWDWSKLIIARSNSQKWSPTRLRDAR